MRWVLLASHSQTCGCDTDIVLENIEKSARKCSCIDGPLQDLQHPSGYNGATSTRPFSALSAISARDANNVSIQTLIRHLSVLNVKSARSANEALRKQQHRHKENEVIFQA